MILLNIGIASVVLFLVLCLFGSNLRFGELTSRLSMTMHQNNLIVSIAGPGIIDGRSIKDIKEQFESSFSQQKGNVVFDLGRIDFIDAQALEVLISMRQKVKQEGYTFRLTNVPDDIRQKVDFSQLRLLLRETELV